MVPVVAICRAGESDKHAGTIVEGQSLSISTQKAAYAPGERIVLKACFQNVGNKDMKATEAFFPTIYHLDVLLPNGKPAPMTLFGKQAIELAGFGADTEMVTLKPGEETCDEIELSRLFDFTLAGKYTVSAQRVVPVNSRLKVTSNKLEITVDESLPHDASSAVPRGGKPAKSN